MTPSRARLAGFLFAAGAGVVWSTTGPLSNALYAEGESVTQIGFWRILIGAIALGAWGLTRRGFFRMDRRGFWLVAGVGGSLVALFEVAYQFGIAGAGVAGAAALLYLAPVVVAVLAQPLLGERVTVVKILLATVVMVGATLTVRGSLHEPFLGDGAFSSVAVGTVGGLLAAASYAGTTILARWAVPRYGTLKVLFWEIAGGTVILGTVLPLVGHAPTVAGTERGWIFLLALAAGPVLGANFLFFAAVKRIEAAWAAVAATIEPVAAAGLALVLFHQRLTPLGWVGLLLVVGGVAGGYLREGRANRGAVVP